MKKLATHHKQKNLVSIRRSEIDPNSIQGFVLDYSDELVVIQYVYDFNLDGLLVMRVSDITEITNGATNKFQKKLLKQEGLLDKVPFGMKLDLSGWGSVISQLSAEHKLIIIESEYEEDKGFFIGSILKNGKQGIQGRYFTGTANWLEQPEKLRFKDITCCKVATNYVDVYQRYFNKNSIEAK